MKGTFVKGLIMVCLTSGLTLFANNAKAFDFTYDNQGWTTAGYFSTIKNADHDYPDGDGAIYFEVGRTDCDDAEYQGEGYRYHRFQKYVRDDNMWENIIGFKFDININEYMSINPGGIDVQGYIIVLAPASPPAHPVPYLKVVLGTFGAVQRKAQRPGDFYTYEYLIDRSLVPTDSVLMSIGIRVQFRGCQRYWGEIYLDNVEPIHLWAEDPAFIEFKVEHKDLEMISLKQNNYELNEEAF